MNWPLLGVHLIALRQSVGLSQDGLASASGVGVKSLSSYETGARLRSIKLAQLEPIVLACGSTLVEFFQSLEDGSPAEGGDDDDEEGDGDQSTSEGYESQYPTPQSSLSPYARNVMHLGRRHSS
jgi:transcriptional regulator with XRE-family HTH domain